MEVTQFERYIWEHLQEDSCYDSSLAHVDALSLRMDMNRIKLSLQWNRCAFPTTFVVFSVRA